MERRDIVHRAAGDLLNRAARWLTDRRRFLTGAGKYGALLMGAAYIPGRSVLETAFAQAGATGSDEKPVELEKGAVRIMGVVQRRPGLTRTEAPFADSPHIVPSYYALVYRQLTKKAPGRELASIQNVVTDCAFGGDRSLPPGPENLHIAQAPPQMPCTTFSNRDMVSEVSFESVVVQGREGGRGWAPNLPRWAEPGTELNLAVRQVLAHGTRPSPIAGGQKAMYFLKMSPSVAAADQVKTWQALHAKAVDALPAFGGGLQGYEVLQRLPEVAPRQTNKCVGAIALPDLVACFWSKDGVKTFSDYARAFRQADKEHALDLPASFFLLVQEYDAAFGGG